MSLENARKRLPHLVDLAERGETTVITRHGKVVARLAPPIKEPTMVTTTIYGTWTNRVDTYSTGVEESVAEYFGPDGSDGFDFDAIVRDYRDAINDALPDGVTLAGAEFIGPAYPEDVTWGTELHDGWGRLNIRAIVERVDLDAIVERHQRTD